MKKRLKNIKGYLVDLDGTTYLSGKALPGAVDFFTYTQKQHIPTLFFSNNPTKHIDEYVTHIMEMNIPVTEDQIITSTHATIQYLQEKNLTKVFVVGTPSFEKELQDANIEIVHENPLAVILSFDLTLTYEKLQKASLLLYHNPTLPYIATNPDLVCPTDEGPIPDCGATIALLEKSTGRTPLIMGKPYAGMINLAIKKTGLKPEEMAVIGDRLYTDMRMGHDHGLTTILVLSGETTQEDLEKNDWKPDYTFKNIGELLISLHNE